MKAHTIAAIGFLALPIVGGVTASQVTAEPQRERQAQENMRWRGMDTNGDGRITRSEWRGSARAFRNHDWNNDGVLSGDEVRPGAVRPDKQTAAVPRERDDTRWAQWTDEDFRELDRNRDGRLTRGEWPHDLQVFARFDRNGDDIVSRDEFLDSAASDTAAADRFAALDADRNGRIEWREWQGTREGFEWLDRNNDGVLSRSETTASDDVPQDVSFAGLDTNRSGAIELHEWPGTRRSFELRDRNNDGRLNESEAGELQSVGTSGGSPGATREIVRIDPQQQWTDTGVILRSGDRLELRADGTIVLSNNNSGNDRANAAGSYSGRRAAGAPVPSAPAGALIARIGDGEPFVIGREVWASRVYESGRLFLGINDDHLADNRGMLRVEISIER